MTELKEVQYKKKLKPAGGSGLKKFRVKYHSSSKAHKGARKPKSGLVALSKLKREADRVFSLYIRAKYPKVCFTCGVSGKTLQCGHFVSRMYLATRWNESNARPQCVGCNIWGAGKPLDFEEHLVKEIGRDEVEKLKDARKTLIKPTRDFYRLLIETYTDRLAKLKEV